jgi:hypothetical protein
MQQILYAFWLRHRYRNFRYNGRVYGRCRIKSMEICVFHPNRVHKGYLSIPVEPDEQAAADILDERFRELGRTLPVHEAGLARHAREWALTLPRNRACPERVVGSPKKAAVPFRVWRRMAYLRDASESACEAALRKIAYEDFGEGAREAVEARQTEARAQQSASDAAVAAMLADFSGSEDEAEDESDEQEYPVRRASNAR